MAPVYPRDFILSSPITPSAATDTVQAVNIHVKNERRSHSGKTGLEGRALQPRGRSPGPVPTQRIPLGRCPPPTCSHILQDATHSPSEAIYSWCCTGALPWQQDNAGGRASRLISLMVLWGPHGRQSGCASQCHLL